MKYSLLLLRLSLGFYFAYAGLSKILNPEWTAAGFLKGAQTFKSLYAWFALPANIGWVNFINEWGLLVVGVLLILGFWVRYASIAGIVFMALYYFPSLNFPLAGEHAYIIDEHIIYITALLTLIAGQAGNYLGLDGRR
ncbi:MAG TPA: DoxX family membrane protein [Candidatus Paceibacterota bacterium]